MPIGAVGSRPTGERIWHPLGVLDDAREVRDEITRRDRGEPVTGALEGWIFCGPCSIYVGATEWGGWYVDAASECERCGVRLLPARARARAGAV